MVILLQYQNTQGFLRFPDELPSGYNIPLNSSNCNSFYIIFKLLSKDSSINYLPNQG